MIATVPSSIMPGSGSRRDHPGRVRNPSCRSTRKTQSSAVATKTPQHDPLLERDGAQLRALLGHHLLVDRKPFRSPVEDVA